MLSCPTCRRSFELGHRFCPQDGSLLEASAADSLVGLTLLGQFELREVIGEGASGTVYRAWQAPMERWVAVKVLHPELAESASMLARMEREARVVGRLSHPGIVGVHAWGRMPGGRPFLVMELVEGEVLEDLLAEGEAIPIDRAVDIVRQVAGALAEAHEAGVVHRDLKPDNLMIVGADRRVKVLDFGVAKLVGGPLLDGDGELTEHGAICGTPHYLSPEQASGDEIDHRADLYSLGVLLYRLTTGRLPFDGDHPVSVLVGHVQETPVEPDEIEPRISRRLSQVIMRCLEKSPAARYGSAAELCSALERAARPLRWTERAPTIAVDDSTAEVEAIGDLPTRRVSRAVAALAALAIAAVAGAAGTAYWLERDPGTEQAERRTPPQPERPAPAAELPDDPEPDVVSTPQGPPRRSVLVGENGYSMRLSLPERIVVGVDYEILLDVWDPDGEPIATSEMVLTVDDPDAGSRGVAAKPTDEPGRYRFNRTFELPGVYQLRVFPPAGGTAISVFVEVIDPTR